MLERIRDAIGTELQSYGLHDVSELRETILIRNGVFCGRKFQCQGYQVVWFVEENQIKFFAPSGKLLRACTAEECISTTVTSQVRRAA